MKPRSITAIRTFAPDNEDKLNGWFAAAPEDCISLWDGRAARRASTRTTPGWFARSATFSRLIHPNNRSPISAVGMKPKGSSSAPRPRNSMLTATAGRDTSKMLSPERRLTLSALG